MEEKTGSRARWFLLMFIGLVLLSGYAIYYTHTQPHYTATITTVGEVTRRTTRSRGSGRKTRYHTTVGVTYTDGEGNPQKADIRVTYSSPWSGPEPGRQFEICQGLRGMTPYPNETLRTLAWVAAIFSAAGAAFSGRILSVSSRYPGQEEAEETQGFEKIPPHEARIKYGFPERVTLQPDGMHRWKCRTGEDYQRQVIAASLKICGGIAAFLLLLGVIVCSMEGDWVYMGLMALCVLVFLLITLLVCWAVSRSDELKWQVYEMDRTGVHVGTGRNSVWFSWKSAQQAVFCGNYFELKGRIQRVRVYVPAEDMETVREYVRARIPAGITDAG